VARVADVGLDPDHVVVFGSDRRSGAIDDLAFATAEADRSVARYSEASHDALA
jgi:hypothetical protein